MISYMESRDLFFPRGSLQLKCLVLLTTDHPAFLAEGTFVSTAAVISCFRFVFTGLIGRVLVFTLLCSWRLPFYNFWQETAVGWTLIRFFDFPTNIEPKFWNAEIFLFSLKLSYRFINFWKALVNSVLIPELIFSLTASVNFSNSSARLRRFNFRNLVISNFTTGQTKIYLINATVLIDGRLCNLWRLNIDGLYHRRNVLKMNQLQFRGTFSFGYYQTVVKN